MGVARGRISRFRLTCVVALTTLSHYRATVRFITSGRCVFQVHASVPVALAHIREIYTGRRDSALIQVATRRSFGEWSQQTPTVKQCHRCLIPTGIQDNRILSGRQSHACNCGADIPTGGMISPAATSIVLSAKLIYSHWCKVFSPRDAMRKRSTSCRPVSVRLSVCHTTLVHCIQTAYEWRQQIPIVKQYHICLIPTKCHNLGQSCLQIASDCNS